MKSFLKTSLKHFIILFVSVLIPFLTTYITSMNFGIWQSAVTAGIAFLVLVMDTLLGIQPTSSTTPPQT